MSPFPKYLLPSMIWLGMYAPAIAAQNQDETCDNELRCATAKQRNVDINNLPVTIIADYAQGQANNRAFYQGDVVITQGYRELKADSVTLENNQTLVTAKGNVRFNDGELYVKSNQMRTNLETEDSEINNATYKLLCSSGRGEAKRVFKNGTTFYQLEDGSFTTCPEGDNSWRFSADRIEKQTGQIFADLYHPRFEIINTPFFYLPYMRIPVEDGRLTGFLSPSITVNDRNGIELEAPFYWNIHPQLDALITPHYMSKRGLFLTFEPRYLTSYGSGSVITEYIGSDREYDDGSSWGVNWKHSGLHNHWQYNVDYARVSDVDYFSRYTDSQVGSRQDNTLLQTGTIAYRDYNWDSTLNVRNFQALNSNTSVYRLLPQAEFDYHNLNLFDTFNFSIATKLSNFDTDDSNKPNALRLYAEPSISLPFNSPWLSASAEAKLRYSYYDQSNIDNVVGINGERLAATATRTVPSVRLHAKMTLERNDTLFGSAYSQTLEPQIQYLYIKEVDQSDIYNPVNYANGGYDTTSLQTDYYGLFRANQFSGTDYINPANQITLGAATRFFDDSYKERFNLAFGQIYYFDRPSDLEDGRINFSAWAIESELNLSDNFFVRSSIEYDNNISELQFGNATAEYRHNEFMLQASYRYVSRNYIANTIGSNNLDLITKDGISQVGLVTQIPLSNQLKLEGQFFYDTTQSMMLENSIHLSYLSDCWVIGIGYNEYLLTRNNINDAPIYDNNISLSFSLLGLGANGGVGYSTSKGNTLGYHNPFALKN